MEEERKEKEKEKRKKKICSLLSPGIAACLVVMVSKWRMESSWVVGPFESRGRPWTTVLPEDAEIVFPLI